MTFIVNDFANVSELSVAFVSLKPPTILTVTQFCPTANCLSGCVAVFSERSDLQQHSDEWLIEQYLTTEVNPEEKKRTTTRRMILIVIWSFEDLIVSILNDQIYYFVPTKTNYAK
jgi:hypothetical protein